jgi:hypothetical protein
LEQDLAQEIGQSYEIIANYKCLVCERKLRQTVQGVTCHSSNSWG